MTDFKKLKEQKKQLEEELKTNKLKQQIAKLEQENKKLTKSKIDLSKVPTQEPLSEKELNELQRNWDKVREFQSLVIKGVTIADTTIKDPEINENKSFGELLADYSVNQNSQININEKMIKEWEKQW